MTNPSDEAAALLRLVGGDPTAPDEVLSLVDATGSASLLAVAALLSADPSLLVRAERAATEPRERQLVALADAHLTGQGDLLDALVRDHLAEHPDHLLAAWIAGRPIPSR